MTNVKKEHGNLIMGCHSLEEILKKDSHRVLKVFLVKGTSDIQSRKEKLLQNLKSLNITVQFIGKNQLDQMCLSTSHQGVAALLRDKPPFDLKKFLSQNRTRSLVVALDSIYDPHNLGAILRASECFGADLVLWSKNRGAKVTPVVSKASSSASELMNTLKVSNLATALDQFKEAGYTLITAELSKDSQNLFEFDFPEKTLVIMGSEGEGVRSILQKKADFRVEIPMYGQIDSLNVSQATALILGLYRRQFA